MVAPHRKKSVVHHNPHDHSHDSTPQKNHHNRVKAAERKRTVSISKEDGIEYNKRLRKLHKEFLNQTEDGHDSEERPRSASNSDVELPILDPDCDPENPKKVTFSEISSAAFNIKNGVQRTPCVRSLQLSTKFEMDLYFKKEYLQVTGSFKERGARYALSKLSSAQKKGGVIAASAGNHALALSYHGQQMSIPVTVVMPVIAPLMKIQFCRSLGATVIIKGESIAVAKEFALKHGRENHLKYINGYDAIDILAGQGTIGLEILEQVPDVDTILVPVGGGGLIAGIAVAVKTLKPEVHIYGIEAETCPSFTEAYKAGHVVNAVAKASLADGLAVPSVGGNSLETSKGLIDKVITVKEENIALSILRLLEVEKAVVEGGGAVGLAAILEGKVPELKGKKVVSILSGGNIDSTVLGRSIERGLAVDGRLVRLDVVVSDRPGGIAELTTTIAQLGASIKDIFHERAWISADVFHVKVKVVAETRGKDHVEEMETALKKIYDNVQLY
uniref:L-serine deaminase n=1 Tax=Caenorhabditis japonica TaxID=281687 RepID=A0A8R1DXB8_CAEJA